MERGRIFNIQRFSLHDGPGIRTTVFFKGCPARCRWCHNPESQSFAPELLIFSNRCMTCAACVDVCPNKVAGPSQMVIPDGCTACGACVRVCPTEARQLAGREATVAEVMAEVVRDRPFYEESGGGVTFSGGEPLAQAEFLRELLVAAKAAGVHTAVDTCGWAPVATLLDLAPLVDLFLWDLKLMDEARHLDATGLPLAPILANLKALAVVGSTIWVRVPLIPGYTDDESNLQAIARLAASLPAVKQLSVLPYHATGEAKFGRLGRAYALAGTIPPSPVQLEAAGEHFRARGLAVGVGG